MIFDHTYSTDVELDHLGRLVAARHLDKGEIITIPLHLMEHAAATDRRGFIAASKRP